MDNPFKRRLGKLLEQKGSLHNPLEAKRDKLLKLQEEIAVSLHNISSPTKGDQEEGMGIAPLYPLVSKKPPTATSGVIPVPEFSPKYQKQKSSLVDIDSGRDRIWQLEREVTFAVEELRAEIARGKHLEGVIRELVEAYEYALKFGRWESYGKLTRLMGSAKEIAEDRYRSSFGLDLSLACERCGRKQSQHSCDLEANEKRCPQCGGKLTVSRVQWECQQCSMEARERNRMDQRKFRARRRLENDNDSNSGTGNGKDIDTGTGHEDRGDPEGTGEESQKGRENL